MRFFEDAVKLPRSVRQVPANVWLHGEAFFLHPFAECAKCRNRINARLVPLFPL
jgi:hypothetical protein